MVNARFVKPLDERLILDLAARCGAIVTVEENVKPGGFGSASWSCWPIGCPCSDAGARRPGPRLRAGVAGASAGAGRLDGRDIAAAARQLVALKQRTCPVWF